MKNQSETDQNEDEDDDDPKWQCVLCSWWNTFDVVECKMCNKTKPNNKRSLSQLLDSGHEGNQCPDALSSPFHSCSKRCQEKWGMESNQNINDLEPPSKRQKVDRNRNGNRDRNRNHNGHQHRDDTDEPELDTSGSWRCSLCTVINDENSNQCAGCTVYRFAGSEGIELQKQSQRNALNAVTLQSVSNRDGANESIINLMHSVEAANRSFKLNEDEDAFDVDDDDEDLNQKLDQHSNQDSDPLNHTDHNTESECSRNVIHNHNGSMKREMDSDDDIDGNTVTLSDHDSDDDVAAVMFQNGITRDLVHRIKGQNAENGKPQMIVMDGNTSTDSSVMDIPSKYDVSGAVATDHRNVENRRKHRNSPSENVSDFDLLSALNLYLC